MRVASLLLCLLLAPQLAAARARRRCRLALAARARRHECRQLRHRARPEPRAADRRSVPEVREPRVLLGRHLPSRRRGVHRAGRRLYRRHEAEAGTASVFNESGNGLSNLRGTVGFARSTEPHSGTSQFYINLADNIDLNPRPTRWGYAVFGKVVEGMEVVDDIGHRPTAGGGTFDRNVPVEPIVIERIELIE